MNKFKITVTFILDKPNLTITLDTKQDYDDMNRLAERIFNPEASSIRFANIRIRAKEILFVTIEELK